VVARGVPEQRQAGDVDRDLRMLAEHAGDMLARLTPDGVYLYVSPSCKRVLGYTQEELIGTSAYAYFAQEDVSERRQVNDQVVATDGTITTLYRRRHKDGRLLWVESTERAVRDDHGDVVELHSASRDVTQRIADEELRRQWEASFQLTTQGISITDPATGIIRSVNPAFARMHGGSPEDYAGLSLVSVFADPDAIPALPDAGVLIYEADHVRVDGSTFPVRTEVVGAYDAGGRALHRVAHYTDITEERRRAAAERDASERFTQVFDHAPIGMMVVGLDNTLILANRAMHKMLGYEPGTLAGRSVAEITHPDDMAMTDEHIAAINRKQVPTSQLEKRFVRADGTVDWALASAAPVLDRDGNVAYRIVHAVDITGRKSMEEALQKLADHDSLTGLWNRRRFLEELERQVARCRRYGEQATLVQLDLDNFKSVNDTLGHAAGDDLLRRVAEALRARVRASDSVCRLGGDEFAALLVGVTAADAEQIAQQICSAINSSTTAPGSDNTTVTVSAGIVSLNESPNSAHDAFLAADSAMYKAKRAGRKRVTRDQPER
jgi:diguanylate cyclase (GGDEF)-like protein/PAS domain S-box-containing protein